MMSSDQQRWFEIINNRGNFVENMYDFVDSTLPADGLAPPSAGTVIPNLAPHAYTSPVLEGSMEQGGNFHSYAN